jgi:hypothetical protein
MMRWIGTVALTAVVLVLAACGGSSGGSNGAIITGQALGDSLALAANKELDERGLFGTRVGQDGGRCQGGPQSWTCTLDVAVEADIDDQRTYTATTDAKGCWIARQTGSDIGGTGTAHRPSHPDRLHGCI